MKKIISVFVTFFVAVFVIMFFAINSNTIIK